MTSMHPLRPSRLAFLLRMAGRLGVVVASAAVAGCDAAVSCRDFRVAMLPGTCFSIRNPCTQDGNWTKSDGFSIDSFMEGVWVSLDRGDGQTRRSLCAASGTPPWLARQVGYSYVSGEDVGGGSVFITIAPRTCPDFSIYVPPGTCSPVRNPCQGDGGWDEGDSFELAEVVEGIFIDQVNSQTFLALCATSDAPPVVNRRVGYLFQRGEEAAVGALLITTTPHSLACRDFSVNVPPGTCFDVRNPCTEDGGWTEGDSFALDDVVEGVFLDQVNSQTFLALCAASDAPPVVNKRVGYRFVREEDAGGAHVLITTTQALEVAALAVPATIQRDETAQLLAKVSGGAPPYSYAWTPAFHLSDASAADPVASPSSTTEYRVEVTDSLGQRQKAVVTVVVSGQ